MAGADDDPPADQKGRQLFVTAGLRALHEHGAAELTMRRIAELAGSSTMGIYTRFGSRAGMLEAIYQHGFNMLRDALGAASDGMADPATMDSEHRIMALAQAYRQFALANPALYALMFERPLPDFDPPPQLRTEARNMTFTLLADEVGQAQRRGQLAGEDPIQPAYLLWTTMHGIISIELTHFARRPLPGWFLDSPEAAERVFADGIRALLAGLR